MLRHFEYELAKVVALSFFISLLIGTGGNTGAQTVSTIIRGLALQEMRVRDTIRVIIRELERLTARCYVGSYCLRTRRTVGQRDSALACCCLSDSGYLHLGQYYWLPDPTDGSSIQDRFCSSVGAFDYNLG